MSRARLARLTREVAAIDQAAAEQRMSQAKRWLHFSLSGLRLTWMGVDGRGKDRAAARGRLEAARTLGMAYFEFGDAWVRTLLANNPLDGPDGATEWPDALQDMVVAWLREVWPNGSRHPCDPDLPEHQRLGALEPDPPSPALLTTWRTHVAAYDHTPGEPSPIWSETAAGITAALAFRYFIGGEGDTGQRAVADWLVANGVQTPGKSKQQAATLAREIATLRQIAADAGYAAARAKLMSRRTGMTEAEAGRILGHSGIAVDADADDSPDAAAVDDTRQAQGPITRLKQAAVPAVPPARKAAKPVPMASPPARPLPSSAPELPRRPVQRERRTGIRERLARRYGPPIEQPRRQLDGLEALERLARF